MARFIFCTRSAASLEILPRRAMWSSSQCVMSVPSTGVENLLASEGPTTSSTVSATSPSVFLPVRPANGAGTSASTAPTPLAAPLMDRRTAPRPSTLRGSSTIDMPNPMVLRAHSLSIPAPSSQVAKFMSARSSLVPNNPRVKPSHGDSMPSRLSGCPPRNIPATASEGRASTSRMPDTALPVCDATPPMIGTLPRSKPPCSSTTPSCAARLFSSC